MENSTRAIEETGRENPPTPPPSPRADEKVHGFEVVHFDEKGVI